jgi:phosphatidylglycerol lysyltransferase
MATPPPAARPAWRWRRLLPMLAPVLLAAILWLLHRELAELHLHDVRAALAAIPGWRLAAALALTAVAFLALSGYDVLGFRFVGQKIAWRRVALASFVGYAFSQALGQGLLTGIPIRARLYTAWSVGADTVARVVAFGFVGFWLGQAAFAGALFVLVPLPWHPAGIRSLGVALLAVAALYCLAGAGRRRSVSVRGFAVNLPGPRMALAQFGVTVLDLTLAASILFVLLPAAGVGFPRFVAAFLLANSAGLLSTLPGGIGVFDTVLLLALPEVPSAALLGAVLSYRAIYQLLPLLAAGLTLGGIEVARHRAALRPLARTVEHWTSAVVPPVLAATTFVGGVVLLVSGATPAAGSRLAGLGRVLPLPVIETSHFLASLIGLGLLILARGLQQRIHAAYVLAAGLFGAGIAASLLKGLDYEEAAILTVLLAALVASRRRFERRASLAAARWTPGWVAAIGTVLVLTAWLVLFSFRHQLYADEMWWQFTLQGGAPRSLRALVGVAALALVAVLSRSLRPSPPPPLPPSAEDLERAAAIAAAAPRTHGYLALLADKRLLFDDGREGFLMYAVEGRSWVALGGPLGPEAIHRELLWRFRDRVERFGGWPVFYQVTDRHLHHYVELGLSLLKQGEEARVELADFSLAGSGRKELRHVVAKLARDGFTFARLEAGEVASRIDELRAVSDAWLAAKSTREKGFSLGFFDPAYLSRFPAAVVLSGERIVAFANVWEGGGKEELSIDLMRYSAAAPRGVMDFLFVELMRWGAAAGFRSFSLGMAPLSGIEERPGAPLWNRFGALVYHHGEHFYNFQGLRRYKEKFDPSWEPRYLASPGGLALPQILANIATLISGGVQGVFRR